MTKKLITPGNKLLIMGEGHGVVKQFPMFGKGEPLYWWHERGYIHWEDARERGTRPAGSYGSMAWQDFAVRVLNLSEMITKSSEDGDYADERRKMQQFVSDCEPLIREAKAHGGLFDEGAAEEHRRRRPKSVVVPRQFNNVVLGGSSADDLGVGQGKMADPFNL